MEDQQKGFNIYYFYVIIAAVCWGMLGLFSGVLTQTSFLPTDLVAIRGVGAAIVFIAVYFIKDRSIFKIELRDIKYFIGTGVISFILMNWCYFNCMKECSISVAAILLYTAPTFVVLMSAALFKERMTKVKVIALILTFIGCCLVAGIIGSDAAFSAVGIFFGVCSGFFYALYSIFGKYALRKYSTYTVTLYTFIFGGFASLFLVDFGHIVTEFKQPKVVLCAGLMALVSTVMSYMFYTKGLEGIETGKASILATIEPVVATLFSVVVWGEKLTVFSVSGIGIIIGAVILLSRSENVRGKDDSTKL